MRRKENRKWRNMTENERNRRQTKKGTVLKQ